MSPIILLVYIIMFWIVAFITHWNRKVNKDLELRTERLEQSINALLMQRVKEANK